jgi:hypothetical protein
MMGGKNQPNANALKCLVTNNNNINLTIITNNMAIYGASEERAARKQRVPGEPERAPWGLESKAWEAKRGQCGAARGRGQRGQRGAEGTLRVTVARYRRMTGAERGQRRAWRAKRAVRVTFVSSCFHSMSLTQVT